ncbi:type II toxin-antitoxin system HipA family toxin [Sphingomonas crocodyli]|uniref:Type II toxin-antitoxin system HipA family toxin n=1 Tax=Sphingomonas crocodyli TaxID=1979270 RepID=A0A437LY56_9SPHN|nr:type II toxin-antitoxin system HipA family toxin [Sphingomonas crocodyli]RVT90312.1 type II toxin-antitoxin system HipA family toxin [Sphingomonas crocodyli]
MVRRRTHIPLNVLINGRLVGRLEKEPSGAVSFQYDQSWLDWPHAFAASLSLPLRTAVYRGALVNAVFDNLLPDNANIRRRVAERTGAEGADPYSLLARIGRDCVGAMQFLPDGTDGGADGTIVAEPLSDANIEAILADLAIAPLGIDADQDFRISIAGAQEKTALLRHEGQWLRPLATTPTTHILKPQLGQIPTSTGMVDMTASVDNEHYCLALLRAFGLPVANTEIATFGKRRVLVVERFDRQWRPDGRLLRVPQEDCCQALGIASSQKYQSEGGPGATDILNLLGSSDDPAADQAAFFASQIIFWLIGATDGHAKNFSLFLRPGGGFRLAPFYDVLTAQMAADRDQLTRKNFRLAMAAGDSRHYRLDEVMGRHFVQTARKTRMGPTPIGKVVIDIRAKADIASDIALKAMPADFAEEVHASVSAAIRRRLDRLDTALAELE